MQGRWRTAAPQGVRLYPSTAEFIAEDPSRALDSPDAIQGELAGWDVGYGFLLAEDDLGSEGEVSEWQILAVESEIYAVCRRLPGHERLTFEGPVWLIGEIPAPMSGAITDRALRTLLWEVERLRLTDDRDSLIQAARIILMGFKMTEHLYLRLGGLAVPIED